MFKIEALNEISRLTYTKFRILLVLIIYTAFKSILGPIAINYTFIYGIHILNFFNVKREISYLKVLSFCRLF